MGMIMNATIPAVIKALADLDYDGCLAAVKNAMEHGVPAWDIVNEGFNAGMREVGSRFEKGDYFLGELVMAGNIMKDVMALLEDKFDKADAGSKGKVILATVKGDIHDLGRKIVGMMLQSSGFEVIDLGSDVDAETITKSVKKTGAKGIGLNMLLTTAIESVNEVIASLKEAGLRNRVKIAIGGASTNQELADDLGLDAYGENAVKAVRIFEELLGVS